MLVAIDRDQGYYLNLDSGFDVLFAEVSAICQQGMLLIESFRVGLPFPEHRGDLLLVVRRLGNV